MVLDYLKQIGSKGAQTFAVAICDACFTVMRSDQTSKVKTMCLPIVIKLVHMKVSTLTAETLRVQHRVETLLTELSYSKNTQTVKGNILQTLGVFAEYFPEHLVNQSKTLLVMLCDLLNEQFKDKKPDYQVIEGGVRGLVSLLVHFSAEVTQDPKKIVSIWRFTLACLNPPEGMKTYAIPKAGLIMVEKHAELFKQYLTEKASVVYPLIKSFCTHATNRSIRKFGFAAMESFLTQVAREIISPDRSKEANMATLRFFFEEFWAGLQERNAGLLASSVFIRGLGIFARSIDFYMGPTEVKKMLHKLIVFSSRFYDPTSASSYPSDSGAESSGSFGASGVDAEETIEHMPSILAAYANIISELPEVDDTCIDSLERIIGTFFLVYPQLYEHQRYSNYKSIARLFVSLHAKSASLQTLLSRIVFKGLILTCSKPVIPGAASNASPPAEIAATEYFFEYQELWRNLIDIRTIPELQLESRVYAELSAMVYKELMEACIKMIRKLDLRYSVVRESDLHLPLSIGNGTDPNATGVVDLNVDSVSLTLTQTELTSSQLGPDDIAPRTSPSPAKKRGRAVKNESVAGSSLPLDSDFSPPNSQSSLPSDFGSSMDLDARSMSQASLDSQSSSQDAFYRSPSSSPNRVRKVKPVADIKKVEFAGCARTMMPGETIKPWVPKDFELFLHLVEFTKLFLPSVKPHLFKPWVYLFCKEVISKSTDYQLVSGLYKLLGVSLKICAKIGFFDGIGSKGMLILDDERSHDEEAEKSAESERNTKRLCFKLITANIRELLLRLRQYRDELLASCIQTVLSIPTQFLDIPAYTPCLVRAFTMGRSFLPLTDIGLSALESWHSEQPNELQSVLHLILPILNPYLYIAKEELEGNLATNERFAAGTDTSSWVFGYGADKPQGATTKNLATTANEYRPEHNMAMQANIQIRIIRLLGKLGGSNAKVISDVDGQSQVVAWDTTQRVSVDLTFNGGVLKLFLDDILPSMCHLATTSSNRQAKISACEFLHAVALNVTNTDDGKGSYEAIYAKLFPIVVKLAADAEKITQQLFESLTQHLIKWSLITGSDKSTNVLLSAVTDALASETDGALRSFAATTSAHFLRLYFELKRGHSSLKTLFSLLHSMACHPNPYYRLGSVLAFREMSRVMSELRSSAAAQWDHSVIQLLEIMHSLFSALQITKSEHQSIGIEAQALKVIDQLGVLIIYFSETLLSYGLSHFVTNLFVAYCGHVRKPVRACAQALFVSLVKLLPTSPSPSAWLRNRMAGTGDVYDECIPLNGATKSSVRPARGSGDASLGTSSQEALLGGSLGDEPHYSFRTSKPVNLAAFEGEELARLFEKAKSVLATSSLDGNECLTWFSGLSAWMDALLWLLKNNFVGVQELTRTGQSTSQIFKQLILFLKAYAMMDLTSGHFASMTASELEAHTTARSTTTLTLFSLAQALFERGAMTLAQDALFRTLSVSIISPHLLGFPLYSSQDQRRVRLSTTKLVSSIVRSLGKFASESAAATNVAAHDAFVKFNTVSSNILNRPELSILRLDFTPGAIDVQKMKFVAIGLYDLQRIGELASRYKNFDELALSLFSLLGRNHANCTPLELDAMRKVVKLALSLPFDPVNLIELLKDLTPARTNASAMVLDEGLPEGEPKASKAVLTLGELFYSHFKSLIDAYFTKNIPRVLRPLLELASTSHPQLFKIVLSILDNQLSELRGGRSSASRIDQILEALSGNFFMSWISSAATFDQRDSMLEYVKKAAILCLSPALSPQASGQTGLAVVPLSFGSEAGDVSPVSDPLREKRRSSVTDFILKTFESFMAKDQPLWFKNRALTLLPILLTRLPAALIPRLMRPVEIMIVSDFPSKSSVLSPDSAAYSEYIGALDLLLSTLSSTHSIELLEALFPILNDSKHVHMMAIDKTLEAFVKGVRNEKIFSVSFTAFVEATPNLETLRLALIRKVCVPYMLHTKRETCMEIMKAHASQIMGIIFPVLPEFTSPKPDSKPPIIDRLTVVARIGAFHLVQALFSALPQQDRDALNALIELPKELVNKAGSLTQKAMKCAFSVRNKKHADYAPDVSPDILLEYQRAAYHCLSTVLMKAQPVNIKFFEVFGFTEDPKKGDMLWEHIVDLNARYTFSVETNFPIANKQVSAIYSKASQKHIEPIYSQNSSSMAASGALTGSMRPRHYLASSYFADSSLSQDVHDSAFFLPPTGAEVSAGVDPSKMEVDASQGSASDELNESTSSQLGSSSGSGAPNEIELDPLNNNPCMFNMLDMIEDMEKKFGSVLAESEFMPVWMNEIFSRFERPDTPLNVKLFITKLVMNKPDAFERFAGDWFAPMCRVLLQNLETVGNPGFNYFVRDLCIVFLKWPGFVPQQAEHKIHAARFLEYLVRNAVHSSRSVVGSNLQIIRLLVERWRTVLIDKVPRKLIFDFLVLERKSARASRFYRLVGLQILGIVVGNKLGLWNDSNFEQGSNLTKRAFLDSVVQLLGNSYKEVHQAAGELIGLSFLYASSGADDTLLSLVNDKLTFLFNTEELNKFVTVIERIARHYPQILDSFLERMLLSLKKLGELKSKALELALARITSMSDPFAAISVSLESLIRHRDDATQLATLNLLHAIYTTIPAKDLIPLVTHLTASFSEHNSESVRSRYLELLMQLYDERRGDMGAGEDALRLALLRGIADPNPDISTTLFEFWDRSDRLSNQPAARLQQLMLKFYHPEVETHWLKMSAHLLLRVFQMHKSFEAVVSTLAPGTEAAEITFDDTVTKMSGIMEPSAAAYVKQTLSDSQMLVDDISERTSPMKKNKDAHTRFHTLYFDTVAPTVADVVHSSSPASVSAATASTNTDGSAVFKTPTKPAPKSARMGPPHRTPPSGSASSGRYRINAMPTLLASPPSTVFDNWNDNAMDEDVQGSQFGSTLTGGNGGNGARTGLTASGLSRDPKVRITRRFLQSNPVASMGSSHFFRQRELARRKEREAQARELTRRRMHHIQLAREYASNVKTISNKDLVAPLMAVALLNDSISRLVLAMLVNAMREQVDAAQLQTTLGQLLESSLSGSSATASATAPSSSAVSSSISTPFINCLLRISHDHPTLVLPSRLIADCAVKSLNFHLGIATLEKQVIKYETLLAGKPATKARSGRRDSAPLSHSEVNVSSPLIDDTWAQLVRLYKLLGEEDILRGLYEKPSLTNRDDLKAALAAELEGEYDSARDSYESILLSVNDLSRSRMALDAEASANDLSENELEMARSGRLDCLAKLSDWKQLSHVIYDTNAAESGTYAGQSIEEIQFVPDLKEDPLFNIWTPSNREKYMKYFLTSCLMDRSRWEFLFNWMDATKDKRNALEGEFSSELAYLCVLRNDIGRADSYVRQSYRHFLGSWSVLPNSMASAAQSRLLQTLQPLLELEEYLTFATNAENMTSSANLHRILEQWRHRFPSQKMDPFEVWERVGRQRAQYFNLIYSHYEDHQRLMATPESSVERAARGFTKTPTDSKSLDVDLTYIRKALKTERDMLHIKMAVAARKQLRLATSDSLLALIEAKLPKGKLPSFTIFSARLKTDFATIRHDFGMSSKSNSASGVGSPTADLFVKYADIYSRIVDREALLQPTAVVQRAEVNLVKSKLFLDVLNMQSSHPSQFSAAWKGSSSETRKALSFVAEGTLKELGKSAFEAIFESASAEAQSKGSSTAGDNATKMLAKTHFKFGRFCDKIASTQSASSKLSYVSDAVTHMFKAIKLGFPEAIGSIPMILRSLSQMRSSSGGAGGSSSSSSSSSISAPLKHLGDIFLKLGKDIPVWTWLPWLNQLIGLMDHPEFVYVLPLLEGVAEAYPQSLYYHFRISTDKDYGTRPVEARLKKLESLLKNDLLDKFVLGMESLTNPEHRAKGWISAISSNFSSNPTLVTKLYRCFVEDCLLVTAETGDLNRQFAMKCQDRSDMKERGLPGAGPVDKELVQKVHRLVSDLAANFTAVADKANTLGQYNKWLDSYASVLGMKVGEIEIPGQYVSAGNRVSKPMPDHHVKVSSFDKSLLIMASMRRPKRLKIRGTDEKEYWFLVKGGEDLRQDQRIEQLFEVCNSLLELNVETQKRHLSIHTYSVIPMTTRAGILEWIRNTQPLKAVIDAHNHPGFKVATEEHDKFLGRNSKTKLPIQDLYKNAFRKTDLLEVEKKLDRQHSALPIDLLRSKIFALSSDPEAFLGIRQRAATSIAVFSVASYIIGIGDRHLDNFLISMTDGEFIGIDFGYAFDAATLLLPIPEMVPFRLTRQMTGLLKPLDSDGLLKLTMIAAISALVQNRHLLLDVMDVFVNEPLLDWTQWASKLPGKPSIEVYTRDRIKTVERKLSLYDPGFITAQLLQVSTHHAEDYCQNLIKIVAPKPGQPKQCPTAKAQVERLIEQATNPHILGMAWGGWCPWV